MFRKAIVAAALLIAFAALEPAAAQRARAGMLSCDVSGGIGFIIGSQRQAGLHVLAGRRRSAGGLSRHDFAVRPRYRRHRRRQHGVGGVLRVRRSAARVRWRATISAPPARRPSRSGSAPTCWSADRTGRLRCSRSRSADRSGSISRSASPSCSCASAADINSKLVIVQRPPRFGRPFSLRGRPARASRPRRAQTPQCAPPRRAPRSGPTAPEWPAVNCVISTMRASLVFIARSLATHLAGSQYWTRGSLMPAVTSMCG